MKIPGKILSLFSFYENLIHQMGSNQTFWVGEVSPSGVSLIEVKKRGELVQILQKFSGNFDSANEFAFNNQLLYKGVLLCTSLTPFNVSVLENYNEEKDLNTEKILELEIQKIPKGTKPEDFLSKVFYRDSSYYQILVRNDVVLDFGKNLPQFLGTYELVFTPFIYLTDLLSIYEYNSGVICIIEEFISHFVISANGKFQDIYSIPLGAVHIQKDSVQFEKTVKNMYRYHFSVNPDIEEVEVTILKGNYTDLAESIFKKLGLDYRIINSVPIDDTKFSNCFKLAELMKEKNNVLTDLIIHHENQEIPSKIQLNWNRFGKLLNWFLVFSIVILVLNMVIMTTYWWLEFSLDKDRKIWEEQVSQRENLKISRKKFEEKYSKVIRMLGTKSKKSESMMLITKYRSPSVWFKNWMYTNTDGNSRHYIEGYCLSQKDLTKFLQNLESNSKFSDVALRFTERIPASQKHIHSISQAITNDFFRFGIDVYE